MKCNPFYVYVYLDPRVAGDFTYGGFQFPYQPFYVGKGKGNRAYDHLSHSSLSGSNTYKNNKIKKIVSEGLSPVIIKVLEDLTDADACMHEIRLIAMIGRANTTGGPLTNNTDGGETSSGAVFSNVSRALMSAQRKGKKQTDAQYAANCSRVMSDEHRKKISEAQRGIRRLSDDQYARIAEKNRGRKRSEESRALMSAQRKGKAQTPAQYTATLAKARRRRELNNFMTLDEFKQFVLALEPSYYTARRLLAYIKENKPARVPRNPYTTYRSEWVSWNNLFGR